MVIVTLIHLHSFYIQLVNINDKRYNKNKNYNFFLNINVFEITNESLYLIFHYFAYYKLNRFANLYYIINQRYHILV
jgi:hypothetical protein